MFGSILGALLLFMTSSVVIYRIQALFIYNYMINPTGKSILILK